MIKKEKINAGDLSKWIIQQFNDKSDQIETSGINIINKIIIGQFIYQKSAALHLNNCLFIDHFGLYNYKPTHRTFFKDCYFLKGIDISGLNSQEGFVLNNCKVRGDFTLEGELKELILIASYINNAVLNIKTNFIFSRGKDSVYLGNLSIYNNSIEKILQLNNCIIGNLNIGYVNIKSEIEIFNSQINTVEIINIRNNGNIRFLNCKSFPIKNKKSEFKLIESNLGKCEFFQFDFASYDEVNIINSVLIDCLFIDCIWTNNIKSYYPDQKDTYNNILHWQANLHLKNKREVYKQLKYALSKQGDAINEHMFHGFEMDTYNASLDKWNYKNLATKTILTLSSLTSNYGQSLLRPILTLIIVNGILFSVLNYFLNLYFLPLSKVRLADIAYIAGRFLWFMNPLHRNESEFSGIILITDIGMRIISSYCIYNIIRASRRFIK